MRIVFVEAVVVEWENKFVGTNQEARILRQRARGNPAIDRFGNQHGKMKRILRLVCPVGWKKWSGGYSRKGSDTQEASLIFPLVLSSWLQLCTSRKRIIVRVLSPPKQEEDRYYSFYSKQGKGFCDLRGTAPSARRV